MKAQKTDFKLYIDSLKRTTEVVMEDFRRRQKEEVMKEDRNEEDKSL